MTGYRNMTDKPEKPRAWTPVIVPKPAFDGPEETRRYQEAVAEIPAVMVKGSWSGWSGSTLPPVQ